MKINIPHFSQLKNWEKFTFSKIDLYIVFIVVMASATISCSEKKPYELRSLKVKDGWGYTISIHHKTVIRQSIIPAIADTKSFVNEKEALKAGNLVIKKLQQNGNPTITRKELHILEITL